MTLKEALESGKHYRRRGEDRYYAPADLPTDDGHFRFSYKDVLADDWEIDETLTIARSQLEPACQRAFNKYPHEEVACWFGKPIHDLLAKELGFKS